MSLLLLLLGAAVEDRMIAVNPIQGLRMAGPRTGHDPRTAMRQVRKRPVPTGDQIMSIADRATDLGGLSAQVMVITAGRGWPPILPGAVFHSLRHHHKSTLDELGIQEALKFERMGHRMRGIAGVHSHATEPMRQNPQERLQQRWTDLSRRP